MTKQSTFEGIAELKAHLATLDASKKSIFILLSGSHDAEGQSWCDDCQKADPVIHKCLSDLEGTESEFITCFVGDKPTWKDPENAFRVDKDFKLTNIPTLLLWKKNKALKEEQCVNEELVKMLFEEAQ